MIDITGMLAGIVTDFESSLDELRDEADAMRHEAVPDQRAPYEPLDGQRLPTTVHVTESGMEEDDIYRWQRWVR